MVLIEVRSMTENTCWEGLEIISEKLFTVFVDLRELDEAPY
jgi:hypothetical protein